MHGSGGIPLRLSSSHKLKSFLGLIFRRTFLDNYFPIHSRNKKKMEFLELEQGGMSLIDYTTKFQNLERYCSRLFDTDQERADKYINGFREGLRSRVITSMPQHFKPLWQQLQRLAQDWERCKGIVVKRPVTIMGTTRGRSQVAKNHDQLFIRGIFRRTTLLHRPSGHYRW